MDQFLETLDHEMPYLNLPSFTSKGYKIDGNYGLKKTCGFSSLQSVDYFFLFKSKGLIFIEFSDLHRGYFQEFKHIVETLKKLITHAKNSDAVLAKDGNEIKRNLIKRLNKIFLSEFSGKFKDSFFLKETILQHNIIDNIPNEIKPGAVPGYFIVVPPLTTLSNHEKAEITRFLDSLQSSLSQKITHYHLTHPVEIITVTDLLRLVP